MKLNNVCSHTVGLFCDECLFERARARAGSEGREMTYPELERILHMSLLQTAYGEVEQVLNVFERDITPEEWEFMIAERIERGSYGLASDAATMAGRSLTPQEITRALLKELESESSGSVTTVILAVKSNKVSADGVNTLIDRCLELALPNTAVALAETIGRKFDPAEVERVATACRDRGHEHRVLDAYKLAA